ncbi:unnamed protein product [Fusarium graminearum]|nr:unnamed protein product [Fusarium graminearum]
MTTYFLRPTDPFLKPASLRGILSRTLIIHHPVATMAEDDPALLEALFHHLVLPPKLPQKFDGENIEMKKSLGVRLLNSSGIVRSAGDPKVWEILKKSLEAIYDLHAGNFSQEDLWTALMNVRDSGGTVWLAIHLEPQNAALIVHMDDGGENVIFEEFETAAPVADVLKTENALTWDFPSRAIAIPTSEFTDHSFINNLTLFLEEASSKSFDSFAARAKKGGKSVVEVRDCPSSALISEILMPLLEGIGSSVYPRQLRKRVRDDVVLDKSEMPWRRLPYWLVLRVTIRRILSTLLDDAHEAMSRVYYKFIICAVLADLLKDCAGSIQPEMTLMLQAKLSRRLAKLESERDSASGPLREAYDHFLTHRSENFHTMLADARAQVTSSWDEYKKSTVRNIPILPDRTSDNDLVLHLLNSRAAFQKLLSHKPKSKRSRVLADPSTLKEGTISQVNALASKHSKLVDCADESMDDAYLKLSTSTYRYGEYAWKIERFIDTVGDAYNGNSLLMSRYLLQLFELWMRMDQEVIKAYPLLKDYHPIFVPSSLDVLCLRTRQEFERLSQVQQYLDSRINALPLDHQTIFANPVRSDSFPRNFVHNTVIGKGLITLGQQIDAESQKAKSSKQSELDRLTKKYDNLTQEIKSMVCVCVRLRDGSKDVNGCKRCWKFRNRKRIKISAYEDLLPTTGTTEKTAQRAAILFQLDMPATLCTYRKAVWKLYILGTAQLSHNKHGTPKLLLENLEKLQKFAKSPSYITLASSKKSFSQTHYSQMRLPKRPSEVLFPFGAEFTYYDTSTSTWADQLPKVPWFQHLLGSWLPKGISDPYASGQSFVQDGRPYHPSSYAIVANEFNCPSELSVHEYSAFQRVVSARGRRWLVLLVELGTTNFNFSSEVTMKLLNHLAVQAGPAIHETGVLREAHSPFDDEAFCNRLYELLRGRLDAITSSWREVHYMNVLVTLSVQLYHLCPEEFQPKAETLLVTIRTITCGWIAHLRNEIRSTSESEVASKSATFAFWAALLGRRTFWVYKDDTRTLNEEDARSFFRASIAIQENLLTDLDQLDPVLRNLLIEDLSNSYAMRYQIEYWWQENYTQLGSSINETWTDTGSSSERSYSQWVCLTGQVGWVTSDVAGTQWTSAQVVHYHLLQGHLIVDGKPLGRLPLQMTQDPAVQELFGEQHLLTRPSGLLEYQLANDIMGHQVHLGFRDGKLVIQALHRGLLLQYVPRDIFKGSSGCDLPTDLVDRCVHWLNLRTGELEMRRKPWIWKTKQSNWILNTRSRVAIRNQSKGNIHRKASPGSKLVEPRSSVGQKIMLIFRHFEDVDKLTIYQPIGKGTLSVEMKRLEIRFAVNNKGLLESPQLNAEVDPNQDVGTLYGLSSQIILRNIVNPEKKTVLVPLGEICWKRRTMHVDIRITNSGQYASFSVDKVLGRLDCAPEPLFLYLKAALHALTSFPIPDDLTLRTGTEEARHCLRAARSQPWSPLRNRPRQILSVLKSLSPKRSYYPPGINLYQSVQWDKNLTMCIQHEELALLVDSILSQSQQLEDVNNKSAADPDIQPQQNSPDLLFRRGRTRRQLYERISSPSDIYAQTSASEPFYYSPIKKMKAKDSCRVYQTICALRANSDDIPRLKRLTPLVEKMAHIGGFENTLTVTDVETLLSTEISQLWASLVQFCREDGQSPSYDSHFLLALLAFDTDIDLSLIQWLVAIYKNPQLRALEAPGHSYFSGFHAFSKPSMDSMTSLIVANQPTHKKFREYDNKGKLQKTRLTVGEYQDKQMEEATLLASRVLKVWPNPLQSVDEFKDATSDLGIRYTNLDKAWESLELELERLSHNLDLSKYLEQLDFTATCLLQHQFDDQKVARKNVWYSQPSPLADPPVHESGEAYRLPSLGEDLMKLKHGFGPRDVARASNVLETSSDKPALQHEPTQQIIASSATSILPDNLSSLDQIINRFSLSSETTIRKKYSEDLHTSLTAMIQNYNTSCSKPKQTTRPMDVEKECVQAYNELHQWEDIIRTTLTNQFPVSTWLNEGGLWPCLSRVALLEQLRNKNSGNLSVEMKAKLVHYGILITRYQRFLRLRDATLCRDDRRLRENEELQGHSNWNPLDHPEWLLLEIDNDLLIRPSQIDVARAVISPTSASNSVLQMNMGQAMLADGKNLCRLGVPRALLLQTAQVVQSRIGGLLDRIVRHVPFSRRSPMDLASMRLYKAIHKDIRDSGGVMICLPEHMMSFKLSGLQQLLDGAVKRASKMMETQQWLEAHSRDILDESDFTLSTKTQLIYPSGIPMAIDGHPQRWLIVEELLSLVEGHIPYLQSQFGSGIDIMRRHEGYPIMHILRPEVEASLIYLLIEDVCHGRLPQLQFKSGDDIDARRLVRAIISGTVIDLPTCQRAAEFLTDDVFGIKVLYLLKGLLSEGLLLTCLKKRWNVQYGLHPKRAPIAVPFEAKGVPSLTAEYGHPDTTLILTCLAFYQTGLTQAQVVQCLDHVVRSDDPTMQYERLIHGCKLPSRLECWNFLTLDDEAQMEDLWKHMRLNTSIVNYFLNNFAFPQHAKQFGVKLQASGWDIPLLSNEAGPSRNLTTGFSGTNDNKRLLPQTIKQDDLPSLVQTNAEVLSYLLEERNQRCYEAIDPSGRHLTEKGLLDLLNNQKIRILIDAGAYILEMENKDLAAAWLEICPDAQGAVYFDSDSRIMVRARFQKSPIPLLASSFANNLKDCVVYIDEAHTRGTDLKLPVDAKGAVTLGLGQTKDQTVQAAMRLRQLGSTQSVAFIVPPEVHRSILDLRPADKKKFWPMASSDVVYWLLEQSCKMNEKMMPLHTAQGFDFCQRINALWKYGESAKNPPETKQLLDAIQHREDQTLEQLYGPRDLIPTTEAMAKLDFDCLKGFTTRLCEQKLDLSGDYTTAFEELELEREVEFEFEQLREKEKPVKYTAAVFPGLDPAITRFVTTGSLSQGDSFIQAFDFMSRTRIGRKFGVQRTSSRLFVSREFTKSIAINGYQVSPDVMRPVEWILWSPLTDTALVVIPEEAELLLMTLRTYGNPVSMLTYAAPVTKTMWRFNTLNYFTIPTRDDAPSFPPWLAIETGVLAGRLYFSYSEYAHLVSWLGINKRDLPAAIQDASSLETRLTARGLFIDRPLKFLLEWLTYRRQTQDIMHTPMGFLCQGKKLDPGHSFFASATTSQEVHEARPDVEGDVDVKSDVGVSDDGSDWDDGDDELIIPDDEEVLEGWR